MLCTTTDAREHTRSLDTLHRLCCWCHNRRVIARITLKLIWRVIVATAFMLVAIAVLLARILLPGHVVLVFDQHLPRTSWQLLQLLNHSRCLHRCTTFAAPLIRLLHIENVQGG